jgi:hypothetical protein
MRLPTASRISIAGRAVPMPSMMLRSMSAQRVAVLDADGRGDHGADHQGDLIGAARGVLAEQGDGQGEQPDRDADGDDDVADAGRFRLLEPAEVARSRSPSGIVLRIILPDTSPLRTTRIAA